MKYFMVISLALFLAVSPFALAHDGLAHKHDDAKTSPTDAKTGGAVGKASDKVIVTVNGAKIMQSQCDELLAPTLAQMKKQDRVPSEQEMGMMRKKAADSLVMDKLIGERMKAAKLEVTDADIKSMIEKEATKRGMTYEVFMSMLSSNGMAEADVKKQVRSFVGTEKVIEAAMKDKVKPVTEAEAKKYYDENISMYTNDEEVKASHILIKTEGMDEADKTKAKTDLGGILSKVKDGADFSELAKTHSGCPSSAKGGDLGFFTRGRMVKPFSDAAFPMKVGEVSDIVETRFGYHIIKVTDRKEAGTQSFESVKDSVIERLGQKSKGEFARGYIKEVRSGATIAWAEDKEAKKADAAKKDDPSKM